MILLVLAGCRDGGSDSLPPINQDSPPVVEPDLPDPPTEPDPDSSRPFSHAITHHDAGDDLGAGVTSIDRVFWLGTDDSIIEPATLPKVTSAGLLDWRGSTLPPDGQQISVTGRRQPEYFCWGEYPQDRAHQHGDDLPRRVVLRLFDLFGRTVGT